MLPKALLILALIPVCLWTGCSNQSASKQTIVAKLDDPWTDEIVDMLLETGARVVCEVKIEQGDTLLDGTCTASMQGIVQTINYRDGQLDGPWKVWHPNGVLAHEASYEKKKQVGRDVSWDEGGHKVAESHWLDGKKDGLGTVWDKNQHVVARIFWVNDEPTKLEQYKDGRLANVLEGSEAKTFLRERALERVREMSGVGVDESSAAH